MKNTLRAGSGLLFRALILSLILGSVVCAQTGTYDWNGASNLGSNAGIKRAYVSVTTPRKMNINCLRVDSTTPGLKFYTTARYASWVADSTETQRKTTRVFIKESQLTDRKVVAAINGDAFSPWPATWNAETLTNLTGLAVSEGTLVSRGTGEPSLIIRKTGTVSMETTISTTDISNIQTAVSGFAFVLINGNPTTGDTSIHPRTGTGLSRDSRFVYLMTIDGRQPTSEGATTDEVGSWLRYFGAYTGINMDGGGSTTMAWWNPSAAGSDKSTLLNSPRGNGSTGSYFVTERCNGNNIGVYYSTPLPEVTASNKAVLDTIMTSAAPNYIWTLGGVVSNRTATAFDIDDGSGVVIHVTGTNSLSNGNYVGVKGTLDSSSHTLTSQNITVY